MSSEAAADANVTEGKVCYVCGIDLTGKSRRKDDKGRYWCVPCSRGTETKKPEIDKKAGKSQCPDCGLTLPTSVLIKSADGVLICEQCRDVREHERLRALARREQFARGGEEERKQTSRLVWLLIVAGLLSVFTVYWNLIRK